LGSESIVGGTVQALRGVTQQDMIAYMVLCDTAQAARKRMASDLLLGQEDGDLIVDLPLPEIHQPIRRRGHKAISATSSGSGEPGPAATNLNHFERQRLSEELNALWERYHVLLRAVDCNDVKWTLALDAHRELQRRMDEAFHRLRGEQHLRNLVGRAQAAWRDRRDLMSASGDLTGYAILLRDWARIKRLEFRISMYLFAARRGWRLDYPIAATQRLTALATP
jgi:hypothetical protein